MEQILETVSNTIRAGWGYATPVVDFLLIAGIIYAILYFLRGTRAINILVGIGGILLAATIVIEIFNLNVFRWLLNNFWGVFATAIVVVFQPELRRALAQLGTPFSMHRKQGQSEAVEELVKAVVQMAHRHCGALIVFEREIGLANYINSAVPLDTRISSLLVQSIFYPNSPLHDGAVIIKGGRIVAGHAILPISQNLPPGQHVGTRHRAALGITEESDAVVVVVSEETGTISAAYRGHLVREIGEADLLAFLRNRIVDSTQKSRVMNNLDSFLSERSTTSSTPRTDNSGEKEKI